MVFSDLFFLFVFIPCFALLYLLGAGADKLTSPVDEALPHTTFRNVVLIIFSLLFYAWGEPVYVFLMLGSVLDNYLTGRWINACQNKQRKIALGIGIALNVAIIGVFKYAGFLAGILADCGLPVPVPNISLPIGISFYTFQSISYLIDVYRKDAVVQKRLSGLLLYISMFPQLIAGPIVRYSTVAAEINQRHVTAQDFADGAYRFFIGLGKKVILANQLGEIADQFMMGELSELTTSGAWVGMIAFTLQIYFDFSGYSDMAIGMGRCMGFHFNENFNHPYCCNSLTDFWRRWHISLGSFFRDYVYIPMGGNRRHQAMNILTVWFLTGMWHGASWNFIIWGMFYGILLMIEKRTILKLNGWIFEPFKHIYSLIAIVIGFGIFYFDDLSRLTDYFTVSFGQSNELHDFVTETAIANHLWLWILAILFCMPIRRWTSTLVERICKGNELQELVFLISRTVITIAMLVLSTALLVGATNNAFIYTRF